MKKFSTIIVMFLAVIVLFGGGVAAYAAISWDNTGKQNLEKVSQNIDLLTQKISTQKVM